MLHSFPLPSYSSAGASPGAGIVPDPLFGSVLSCSAPRGDGGAGGLVGLDPVQYATRGGGPFSVNLWFKAGNLSGAAAAVAATAASAWNLGESCVAANTHSAVALWQRLLPRRRCLPLPRHPRRQRPQLPVLPQRRR